MADFNKSIEIVFKNEGGYVNNPNDPGGETNFGISKANYPFTDIKNLTKDEAKKIYYNDFWLKNKLDIVLNQNIADFALDTLVQHGQGAKLIQMALNASGQNVAEDNRIGSNTVDALNTVDPDRFVINGVRIRKNYYDSLIRKNPALAEFRPGWFKRVGFFLLKTKSVMLGGTALILIIAAYFLLKRK